MRRPVLLITVAGLLCVLVLLWLQQLSRPVQSQPTSASGTVSGPQQPLQPAGDPLDLANAPPPSKGQIDAVPDNAALGANNPSAALPGFLSLKTPIEFYGKVVDEKEVPIPGVRVYFGRVDESPANFTETTTQSDSNGLFALTGAGGKTLDVRLEKRGYHFSRTQNPLVFEYSNPYDKNYHRSDKASPVVFHLKKQGQTEPLVTTKKDVSLRSDGSPVEVDLAKAEIVGAGEGDLVVRYHRGPLGTRYDWICVIEVPKGGLIGLTNELEFVAPEAGYLPAEEISMPQSSPTWQSGIERQYFLKLSGGRFAKMRFRLRTGTTDSFRIEYLLNPSGSRNLEFDPLKAIQPAK